MVLQIKPVKRVGTPLMPLSDYLSHIVKSVVWYLVAEILSFYEELLPGCLSCMANDDDELV
jgi:hypothetical protein